MISTAYTQKLNVKQQQYDLKKLVTVVQLS